MKYKKLQRDKNGNIDMEMLKEDKERLEILDNLHRCIIEKLKENLYPPSVNEIAVAMKMPKEKIKWYLEDLEELGLLEQPQKGRPHTIKVKGFQLNRMGIPLCAFCGGETTFVNDNIVTKAAVREEEYECPHCGAHARYTLLKK